jgi:hypothetical protein
VPALPPVPGVVKIIVKQSLAGVPVYNVLHAWKGSSAGWTQTDLNSFATMFRGAWVTNVIPLQANTLTLTDVQVVDLTSNAGGEATASGSTAGTGSGSANPANVCICWSWKQSLRYRGGHPRTYIAAIPNTANSNANTITTTAKNAHATAAAAVRTAVNGFSDGIQNAQLCYVSYYQNSAIRATPYIGVITGVSVDDRFDSQRRRLGRDRL